MRKIASNNKTTIFVCIIFVLIYVLNICIGNDIIFNALSGSGFKKLNGEVYRIFTASFLHANLLHLVANIIALLAVGSFLEKRLGALNMLLIYIASDMIASLMFYGYMNECTNGNGSSIAIYAMFAVLLVLWLRYPEKYVLTWKSPALFYIIIYFFAASIYSGNFTTMIIHSFGFITGIIVGLCLLRRQGGT